MALQLRALAVLTEDLSWVPSTQVRQVAVICNSSFDIWGFAGTHPPSTYTWLKQLLIIAKEGNNPKHMMRR